MRVDEFPVVEPQTSPEVVHEHRESGHNSKYTPWTTKLVTVTRCKTAERTRKGLANIRVMSIEFLVPLLALVGDFDEVFFFGRLRRSLAHGVRSTHGKWYNEREGEERRAVRDLYHFIDRPIRRFRDSDATRFLMAVFTSMSEIGILQSFNIHASNLNVHRNVPATFLWPRYRRSVSSF